MSDSPELQALINNAISMGQHCLYLPARTWVLARDGRSDGGPCVTLPPTASNFKIIGVGAGNTIFRMADNQPPSTRTMYVQSPGSMIQGVSFDGGAQSDKDEHRAGVFVMAPGLRLIDVTSENHTGDGFYLYTHADDTTLSGCISRNNVRDGIVFGSDLDNINLVDSQFIKNGAQQVDTEPGVGAVVSGLMMHRCLMDAQGASNDYVLTLGGNDPNVHGRNVTISECIINGAINLVWGDKVTINDCNGVNSSTKSCLDINRNCRNISLSRNSFFALNSKHGIQVLGTGEGSVPSNISIEDNNITCASDGAIGVFASCIDTFYMRGNVLKGNGVSVKGSAGINVRAVTFITPALRAVIENNDIRSFGDMGFVLTGNQETNNDGTKTFAKIDELWLRGNTFGNREGMSSLKRGAVLDDGSNIANHIFLGSKNVFESGVSQPILTQNTVYL